MPVTFSEQSTTTFPQPAAGGRMSFIDVDGDGDQDILFQTGADGTSFSYAVSNGDGTYSIVAQGASPFAGVTLPNHGGGNYHVGDVDGDGDLDLWVGVNGSTGSYFRNDNGVFSTQSSATFPAPAAGSRVVMADFDGDGDADILYQTGANGTAFQYGRSNGDGTYSLLAQGASPFAGLTLLDNGGGTHIAADFDGDGDLDLWNTEASATGSYFRNDGGTFSSQSSATFPAAAAITRYVVGDFDSDGDADILYQTAGNGTVFQYARANGDGTMTILSQAASPFAGVSFVDHSGSNFIAGDVDGDGDDDIIATPNSTQGEFYLANGKPPELSSSTPSDNSTGVSTTANIVLTFDESVTKNAGNIYLYRGDGTLIETISVGSAQVTGSGTTWTIDPSVTLQGLTGYYILLDDGIFRDADGSIFAGVSDPTTLNFTTAAVITPPVFTNLNGDTADYTESGFVARLDVGGNATVTDTSSANFDTGTLTVSITAGGSAAQDVLSIASIGTGPGQISVSGSAVSYQGVQIGTVTGGTGGVNLVITFDADATPAAAQALVRALQYSNSSDAPSTTTRTVTIVLTDGDGGTSAIQTTNVTVTGVNDAPVNVVPAGPIAAVEDGPAVAVTGLSISDIDANPASDVVTVTLNVTSGGLTINTGVGGGVGAGSVTGNGTDTVVLTGTINQINATLANATGVQFQSTTANFNGAVTLTMTTNDQGASGNDPGLTGTGTSEADQDTVTINVAAANDPHIGGVSVTGTTTENQVLTAVSTLGDADGIGTLHYDWQRDTGAGFVSIGAADQATYTLGDADVGAVVRVVVSYTDAGGTTESSTSAGTTSISAVNDPHTGGASITGTATEDQVLTAVSTLADADGLGTLHYDWQRDTGSGFVSIGAADQATYVLGDADVGAVVRVVISYTDGQGFSESATSASTAAIANVNDLHTGGASVTGTATENQVLTAVSTMADADGLGTLHYQWQRDTGSGYVNVGTDQATYTLGDADVGGVVRVVISYTDGEGTVESATSGASASISAVNDPHTGGASITGTTTEDQILTAVSTLADADGLGTLHYDWQRNTGAGFVSIGAADQATYALGDADVGAVIRVVISYTDGQGFSESATSASTATIANVNDPHTGGASITGTATEDQVLTAVSTLADVDGLGTMHYDWQRDTGSGFVSIGAADQSTYTLGDADVGAVIRVVISYTDGHGTVESATSGATATIANVDDAAVAVDDSDAVLESAVTAGSVFANDSDPDGPALSVSAVNGSAADVGTQITLPSGALLTLNGDGTYSYDPNDAFNALSGPGSGGTNLTATDSFTYTLTNGNTATVTITVVGEDSPGDSVQGDNGDNTLTAGDGEDTLVGGGGNDNLDGGDGIDTADYSGSTGGVHIRLNGGFGEDGEGGMDTLANIENLTGSANDDILIGANSGNVLSGGDGGDILIGLGGDDTLVGGAGAPNQLQGGEGDDTYWVEANDTVVEFVNQGHDRIFTSRNVMTLVANVEELHFTGSGAFIGTGNALDNVITGGAGDDLLVGGAGADTLHGGTAGTDTVSYAASSTTVSVNLLTGVGGDSSGTDTLINIDNVIGGSGNDSLTGNLDANVLAGGAGDDVLAGSGGDDTLLGGLGVDTADYQDASSGVLVRLDLNTAQDGDGGTDSLSSIESARGSAFNDVLFGNAGDHQLSGGAGADILLGRDGDDFLIGGAGAANTLYGGSGDDTYYVSANDTIHEFAGEGTDTVITDRAYFALAANVENLTYDGAGDFAGVGNALNNVLTGGDGRDTLAGGQGDDTLNGGAGHDTAEFSGTFSQYTIESIGGGQYRVTDTVAGRDGVDILTDIEQLRFSDRISLLGAPAAPALTAKEMAAAVSPLMDDAFIVPKDLDLPLVLPETFDDAFAGLGSDAPSFAHTGSAMLFEDAAGLLAPFEDHGGARHHDDWMV